MSAIGIDPGIHGALAHYERGRVVDIIDMPTFPMVINKKQRDRLDMVKLADWLMVKKMMGVQVVMMEAVGGRPQQSASAAFVFGYTVGALFALCIQIRLPVTTVPASIWKKVLQCPGKKLKQSKKMDPAYASKIITRADELIPEDRNKWRGPNGGLKVDRAEAALLGYYGVHYQLRVPGNIDHPGLAEYKLIYEKAEVGA
jgi:hypothetical protein